MKRCYFFEDFQYKPNYYLNIENFGTKMNKNAIFRSYIENIESLNYKFCIYYQKL